MMPDINEAIARLYELLRDHEEALFAMARKIQSLEMALDTNQSFAELHLQTWEKASTPESLAANEQKLRSLDAVAQAFRDIHKPKPN